MEPAGWMLVAMSTPRAIVPSSPSDLSTLDALVDRARAYAVDSRSASTRRAYVTDFRAFETWCAAHGVSAIPAEPTLVAVYASALADAGKKVSSIERALSAIAHAQRTRGIDWPRSHPVLAEVLRGIRRRLGVAPQKKAPVCDDELAALVATLEDGMAGLRDHALLTLGWFSALRRASLVALNVADIARPREGLLVTVRRSKTDQEGRGKVLAIAYASKPELCAVRSLEAWLSASGITEGPIFRGVDRTGHVRKTRLSDRSVALIVQRCAKCAGLDPMKLAAHSLRSGFMTTAARRGKSLDAIMRQTDHRTERVARGYIQHAKMFDDNATVGLV